MGKVTGESTAMIDSFVTIFLAIFLTLQFIFSLTMNVAMEKMRTVRPNVSDIDSSFHAAMLTGKFLLAFYVFSTSFCL